MSIRAAFVDDPGAWSAAHRLALGNDSGQAAAACVGIGLGPEARWRIDLSASLGSSCFRDVRCVGERVYIGYGQQVAVFAPKTGSLASHPLDGYFGSLFTALEDDSPDLGPSVLVASASELLRFDGSGQLAWRRSALGIDGVRVRRVQDGEILGAAERDPPGGWKPFRLRLDSGADRVPDLLVTRVERFGPASESAAVTLASDLGEVVVFGFPCDVAAGARVPNRLGVLDAPVLQAPFPRDRPDQERRRSAVDRLERTGAYAYAGCGVVLDAAEGLVLARGFVLDFGAVPLGAEYVEFEIARLGLS